MVLGEELSRHGNHDGSIVIALPRGGVEVAFEISAALRLPLDVFIVRKLGVPGQEELAMGALASGGIRLLNREVVDSLGISSKDVDLVTERERREMDRRENLFREGRPMETVSGRTVILVDDGIATGSTMAVAIIALREARAAAIVVAVPVMPASALPRFEKLADKVVAILTPADFQAVGQWYGDFTQTTDAEVRRLLAMAAKPS